MGKLVIHEHLAERLQDLAARENRPVEELLTSLLDRYTAQSDALAAMDGAFNDDASDLSTTVRETVSAYYKKQYGLSG